MNTKLQNIPTDKIYILGAFSLLVFLFILYIYFVSASVVHVVIRQEIQQQIGTMHSQISKLETDYIRAQHTVSEDIAALSGYVDATDKVFIHKAKDTALVLSSNQE